MLKGQNMIVFLTDLKFEFHQGGLIDAWDFEGTEAVEIDG